MPQALHATGSHQPSTRPATSYQLPATNHAERTKRAIPVRPRTKHLPDQTNYELPATSYRARAKRARSIHQLLQWRIEVERSEEEPAAGFGLAAGLADQRRGVVPEGEAVDGDAAPRPHFMR